MAEIVRSFDYDDNGDPVMILRKKRVASKTFKLEYDKPVSFAIRMTDVWQYSEEHNPAFRNHMMFICGKIHDLFDLGLVTIQKLSAIAGIIQEGIDDLVKMKPKSYQSVSVGEATIGHMPLSGDHSGEYEEFTKELVIEI